MGQNFFESEEDGCKLFYQGFSTENHKNPQKVIFVHGALEHSSRYKKLFSFLNQRGVDCYTYDLRGHGHSQGSKGDSKNFHTFISDLESFVEHLTEHHGLKDFSLIGHSLGGLIVLSYCIKHDGQKRIKRAYVSAPALSVKLDLTMKIKQFVANNILIKIAPKIKLPVGLNMNSISHDLQEIKKYKEDPLIFDLMSVRQALSILKQGERAIKQAHLLQTIPVFLAHGDEDLITYKDGSERFFNKLLTPSKKIKIYKGYYHELFNEDSKRRDVVYRDLVEFLSESSQD